MTAIKRYKVLYNDSAAETSEWFRLDVRYDHDTVRTLNIELTAGDTITIEGTTFDVRGTDKQRRDGLAALTAEDIGTLNTYTTSDTDNLTGPWTHIRVVKTGTTGNAKVSGFI